MSRIEGVSPVLTGTLLCQDAMEHVVQGCLAEARDEYLTAKGIFLGAGFSADAQKCEQSVKTIDEMIRNRNRIQLFGLGGR